MRINENQELFLAVPQTRPVTSQIAVFAVESPEKHQSILKFCRLCHIFGVYISEANGEVYLSFFKAPDKCFNLSTAFQDFSPIIFTVFD